MSPSQTIVPHVAAVVPSTAQTNLPVAGSKHVTLLSPEIASNSRPSVWHNDGVENDILSGRAVRQACFPVRRSRAVRKLSPSYSAEMISVPRYKTGEGA